MDNYYQNSASVKGIEKACDMAQVGWTFEVSTNRKKRSSESMEDVGIEDLFDEVYRELAFTESFPTFRTYVLGAFYLLLSHNEDSGYYEQIMGYVLMFRDIMNAADKAIYTGRRKDAYFLLVDDMVMLLKKTKHCILHFHLDAHPVP
jgi:hypothetical protein